MPLLKNIVSILASATTFYMDMLNDLSNHQVYGISCGAKWDDAINLDAIINTLSYSYSNSLISQTTSPQLSSSDYECLLGKLQEIIANGF